MIPVMIVAAEASSALFAQRLLEHWEKIGLKIEAFGVGTRQMEQLGFERIGKSEEMAVVGIAEAIEHYSHLKLVFNNLVKAAEERKPRVVIVLDYPDFNLMLSKKLHAMNIPVVYYVSPQVWAWRKSRIHKIKKYCQEVLLLFPFEKKFYEQNNVPHYFVGHPALDDLNPELLDRKSQLLARSRYGIKDTDIVLGLMPGSRKSEVRQLLQVQLETAKLLVKKLPNLKVFLLVAPTFDVDYLKDQLAESQFPIHLIKDEPFKMISMVDYMLVASGTATLMVGLLEKPMLIMYKMKWLTWIIAKIFVRGIKFMGLVNLILQKEACKEFFQLQVTPENMSKEVQRLIEDQSYRESVIQDLKSLKVFLGDKGATERVASRVMRYLQ